MHRWWCAACTVIIKDLQVVLICTRSKINASYIDIQVHSSLTQARAQCKSQTQSGWCANVGAAPRGPHISLPCLCWSVLAIQRNPSCNTAKKEHQQSVLLTLPACVYLSGYIVSAYTYNICVCELLLSQKLYYTDRQPYLHHFMYSTRHNYTVAIYKWACKEWTIGVEKCFHF